MKLPVAEHARFNAVMAHYQLTAEEIELCRTAYRNHPESGRITYESIYAEINWRETMATGITERIKAFQELKRALLAKAENLEAGGPGQEPPLRPPPAENPARPTPPTRQDPPAERDAA